MSSNRGEHPDLGATQAFGYNTPIPCPSSSRRSVPMKITVQLVVCDDADHQETLTEGIVLEKACQRIEQVGLTLAEAKALLSALQQQIVTRQAATFLAMCKQCQACGTPLRPKGQPTSTLRPLFG